MTRKTSIDVYYQIMNEGLLSKLRAQVYEALYKHGPCTALELYTKCFKNTHRDHSITPRFSELERHTVIASLPSRACAVSGRIAIVWETTNNLPVKFEKPVRHRCNSCKGKGYHEETQTKFF